MIEAKGPLRTPHAARSMYTMHVLISQSTKSSRRRLLSSWYPLRLRHGEPPAGDGRIPLPVVPPVQLPDPHDRQGVRQRRFQLAPEQAADGRGHGAVIGPGLQEELVDAELPRLRLGLRPADELEQGGGDGVEVLVVCSRRRIEGMMGSREFGLLPPMPTCLRTCVTRSAARSQENSAARSHARSSPVCRRLGWREGLGELRLAGLAQCCRCRLRFLSPCILSPSIRPSPPPMEYSPSARALAAVIQTPCSHLMCPSSCATTACSC